jgi:ribosomal protein S18 acetylase RimI-like enzyme
VVTFERATRADADIVVSVEANIGEAKTYGQPLELEAVVEEIANNAFYIIKDGDAVVGTCAHRVRSDRSAYLSNIAVLPAFRGRGMGRAAVTFLLAECHEAETIDLVTHPENAVALKLYGSLGFKVLSRKEDFFGDGEPRLVLERRRFGPDDV